MLGLPHMVPSSRQHWQYSRNEEDVSDAEDLDDSVSHPSKIWRIAKNPPFANVSIDYIENHHDLSNFLQVLTSFVWKHMSNAPTPSKYDCFNLYKQVSLTLPPNRYICKRQSKHWPNTDDSCSWATRTVIWGCSPVWHGICDWISCYL